MDKILMDELWQRLDEKEKCQLYQFYRLLNIMSQLRSDNGCPWDREQTHETLKPYLLEETYEVLEQLEEKSVEGLKEELGDLLLQIIFHARIAAEEGQFNIEDIIKGLNEKLIRRHPHIFGEVKVKDSEEVLINWEKIKAQEKKNTTDRSLLDKINSYQPALMEAQKLQEKAAKVGFDWENIEGALLKVEEELNELKKAYKDNDEKGINEEIGDLLFAVVNVARFAKVHSELALRETNKKFRRRFKAIETRVKQEGQKIEDLPLEVLDGYWNDIKKMEKKS